jgi:hypothetical protein
MNRALCGVLVALTWSGVASAQGTKPAPKPAVTAPAARPDFGGTWVFDADATKANAAAAKVDGVALFLGQFVAEQNPQTFTMKIDLGQMIVTAVYNLDGSPSKNMSPPNTPGAAPIEVTSRAHWTGAKLVITSTSQSPGKNGPVTVRSTRSLWLDANGRMVIERSGTPRDIVRTSRSVYGRKP